MDKREFRRVLRSLGDDYNELLDLAERIEKRTTHISKTSWLAHSRATEIIEEYNEESDDYNEQRDGVEFDVLEALIDEARALSNAFSALALWAGEAEGIADAIKDKLDDFWYECEEEEDEDEEEDNDGWDDEDDDLIHERVAQFRRNACPSPAPIS